MKKSVVIEQSAGLTPFGSLDETVALLSAGKSALRPGPCFDVPTAFAPFANERYRDVRWAAQSLANTVSLPANSATVFINSSAKGDIHSLEDVVAGTIKKPDILPLLDAQAEAVLDTIHLAPCRRLCISNACASGAIALECAKELLESGRCESVVLFGIECLSRFVATGFHALSALSPTGARPFDAGRDGLSLGEAAAMAVLAYRQPHAGDICVAGAASTNDANHRTGPSRTGDGLFRAAQAALDDAGMSANEIGAVKCHGTATLYNDAMESKAIDRLFGKACPPCVSFKGAIGHTSGAGSLLEALLAAACLKQRRLPPTAGYERHGVDEKIAVSNVSQTISAPSILCLSAGFGGVNAAIVIQESV